MGKGWKGGDVVRSTAKRAILVPSETAAGHTKDRAGRILKGNSSPWVQTLLRTRSPPSARVEMDSLTRPH